MKFFAVASAALAALSSFTGVVAQSPATVVKDFKMITDLSSQAQTMVSQITVVNAIFQGPKVAQTLQQIIVTVTGAVPDCLGPNGAAPVPFGDADAQEVVNVLTTFVGVHQQLLSTLIGKHGVLSLFPFTQPIAAALRQLEGIVDSIAFALITIIPTKKDDAMVQISSLDASITAAYNTYNAPDGLLGAL